MMRQTDQERKDKLLDLGEENILKSVFIYFFNNEQKVKKAKVN